jgi:hypothetical protein
VADKILIQVIVSASAADTPRDVLQRHRRQIEILTTKGNPTPELIDKLAPGLVRNILRRAGAGDCAKANLPKPLKRRLDLMCQFKHPAALIIQDWLDGNRAFLPTNLQTIADYSTCCRGAKVMSKISKRVSKYLIARQQRAARLEAFGRGHGCWHS